MWWILLLPEALAAPDRVAETFALGTNVGAIAVSGDGRWVAAVEHGSQQLRVLDTWSWDASRWDSAPCDDLSGVAGVSLADGTERFYVGCSGGLVSYVDVSTGDVELADEPIEVGEGQILGLVSGDGQVWALEESGSGLVLHHLDPETGLVDGTGAFPVGLTQTGYEKLLWTGVDVVLLHGGDSVSQVDGDAGGLYVPDTLVSGLDCVEGAVGTGPSVLAACGSLGVFRYITTTYEWALALDDGDGLADATAIAVDEHDEGDPYVIVGDDGAALVYAYDAATGYPDDDVLAEIDLGGSTLESLVSTEGYAVASTDGGELWVLTGRPWVEITAISAETAVNGDTISLDFSADRGGAWELVLGEDDETSLASGSIAAGETASASFEVSAQVADFQEGANLLRLRLTDEDDQVGQDGVILTVDNPPSRVSLDEESVTYGENTVLVSWEGVDDEDLAAYRLYLAVSEFSASEWGTGGPSFDGEDDLTGLEGWDAETGSLLVADAAPGEQISVTLYPLTNGTTYWLAVRAIDEGGQEGAMSKVVSVTPQETYSLAERTGDEGGFCGTSGASSGLAALTAGLFALLRARARRSGQLGAALALGLVGLSGAAQAAETAEPKPASNLQLRFGPMWFDDENKIYDQFEAPHNILWLEGGPSLWGIAELNLGIGFYNKAGYLLGEDGSLAEAQADRLTALPVTLSGTLRLDVLKEQPIVPIATIGGDYWLWRERWDQGDDKDQVAGGKAGWHYGLGAQLLLDVFDRKQASLLDARAGIRDSYLVGEYRVQTIGDGEGIDLSASSVTLGLKVNY